MDLNSLESFDFDLPKMLVAQSPVTPRDSSRLLYIPAAPKQQSFSDLHFKDVSRLLRGGDVLIFNNSKVIPAFLEGKIEKNKINISINLIKPLTSNFSEWQILCKPYKKIKLHDLIIFEEKFCATVIAIPAKSFMVIRFNQQGEGFWRHLFKNGKMPLPPYIKRDATQEDNSAYQTVYASTNGSVAAPTAGLHFSEGLIESIQNLGIRLAFITLHIGAGTFTPVRSENLSEHHMHSEWATIPQQTCDLVNSAIAEKRRVIAVGTSTLRAIESAAHLDNGRYYLKEAALQTDIFIKPGYNFKIIDALITNFHLPKSTLFVLVCAFAGYEVMHRAYQHAISNQYRFFSYGDACFLER